MSEAKSKKKKLSPKSKALSIILAVLLVLLIFLFFDFGLPFVEERINPPERKIYHDDNAGKITEFNLIIEKLAIDVPIIANVDGRDKNVYNQALNDGVAHYKNTALPNSGSNIVIFGHSSTFLGAGEYSKVFAALNDLNTDDEIKINFNRQEYKYKVSEKKIIPADDLSVLLPTEREMLTLLTCWPVGTADKRLVVIAKPEK